MENVKYYYVPIAAVRRLLDCPRDVVGRIDQQAQAGAYNAPHKGEIFYQITDLQLFNMQEFARENAADYLLAFIGFQALKSIVGRKRGQWVNTSNWLMLARMAGYRTFGELTTATYEETGEKFYSLVNGGFSYRYLQKECEKIRKLIAERYRIVQFAPSSTGRGFAVKIENDWYTTGGSWFDNIVKVEAPSK